MSELDLLRKVSDDPGYKLARELWKFSDRMAETSGSSLSPSNDLIQVIRNYPPL